MSIYLIDKIKPKNNGNFPMVDAADVEMPDGKRLSEVDLSGGPGSSITLDTTLSKAGQAADAGAVGAAFQQASKDITLSLQFLQAAIPTADSINALIDNKLGVIENGSY